MLASNIFHEALHSSVLSAHGLCYAQMLLSCVVDTPLIHLTLFTLFLYSCTITFAVSWERNNISCRPLTFTSLKDGKFLFVGHVLAIIFPAVSLEVHNMTFKVNTPPWLSLWIHVRNTMKHWELLITLKGQWNQLQPLLSCVGRQL